MAITCALGDKHIKALTGVISKAMLNASEKGESFDTYAFMNNLYSNLKERQGVDNAIQYMQQVPYIANRIDAKLEIELSKDANGNEISLKVLSKSFRNEENGINTTLSFFEKTMSPESLAIIAYDNANKPVEKFEYQEPEVETDVIDFADDRLKARTILSGTHEEFVAKNPDEVVTEKLDKSKLATVNAIGRISVAARDISSLDNIKIDGVELKLQPKPLTKIAEEDRTEYSNNMILRQNAIISEGKTSITIPAKEQIALVIVDTNGIPVYFDEQGRVTTKENGGRLVYQMLRNVIQEKGRFTAVNIYGYKNQIISPIKEAELQLRDSGLTKEQFEKEVGMSMAEYVQEIDRQQQEDFKKIYDLKKDVVEKNATRTINLTGASRGVFNLKSEKNITLSKITSVFPQIAEDIVKTIKNLETPYNNFKSGDTVAVINDEVVKIDRSQITKETADKIAAVLTNSKINSTEKLAFYHQFFTNQKITIPTSIQRHDLNYKGTKLVFSYVPYTRKQVELNPSLKKQNEQLREIDLNSPTAAKEISDIFMSGWSTKAGELAPANMVYKTSLIDGTQTYFDYIDEKLLPMGQSAYIDFVLKQNGKLLIAGTKIIPLYNAYLKFSLDTTITDQINEAQETVKEKQDIRSDIRRFKDDLVAELKADPNFKPSAEVVNVTKTESGDITVTVKIDGKEGEHKFYRSTIEPKIGDKLSMGLNPIEIKDGFGFPDNVSFYTVSNGKINYYGNLSETDFNSKEPSRAPIPMQQDYVAETLEQESLDEVQVAPKVVTEEQSDVQVSQGTNPSISENPADDSVISQLIKSFNLKRSTNLPSGVTGEQVENAINWWNNSPLNKYLALEQVANIVNSDAYARFIVAGSTLLAGQYTGKLGAIQINEATKGSMVDTYHEAWHGFSQLFLTRQEKIDLYNELKKSNPKYKKYSFLELEEILAEDFRSYALNQNTKPKSPKRNTLFRRILNFLKKLFGGDTSTADNIQPYNVESQGVAGELFRNLYLASSNPDLLNIYTPSIDNVMFDILNRGIMQVGSKNEPALSPRDSEIVNDSVDSLLSEVVDDSFDLRRQADPLTANKSGTTKIITDLENREVAYEIVKEKFKERLKTLRDKLKTTPEKPFASFNTLQNLEDNASAVIRSSKGDHKYVFLKSQIDDYNNLSLATKAGQRVKGEIYKKTIEVIGDFYTHNSIKDTTKDNATILVVDTIEEAKAQFDSYREGGAESFDKFQINPLVNAKSTYEISSNQSRILDSIRVLQTAVRHWDSVIKYNQSNSDYEIVKKEYGIEKTNEEEDATEDVTKSEKVKSEVGKETLFELAGKDVVYILRSLHKKITVGGTYVNEFNELGFKKRADFRKVWATLVKATQGTKDPQEMYKKIVEASANFDELKQLIEYKLPVPDQSNTSYEFDITTSFWSVFSLPKVQYKQLSLFRAEEGLTTEVTSGSLDVKNVVRSFQSNFQSDKNNTYAIVSKDNVSYLNLDKVVSTFSKAGEFDDSKTIDFLKAIGINLEDTTKLKEEILNLKNRTYYGVPYIFDTIKELNVLDKKGVKTKEENELLAQFKRDPISVLSKGIPAKTIGEKGSKYYNQGSKQKTQIERIAELQMTLGFGINSMSASNAEGNKVNEVTTDNTLTFLADALNTVDSRTNMYKEGNPLRFLDPKNNPWASSSITLKNLFSASDARDGKRNIIVDLVSGTQRTDAEITDGQNTTNLSQQGKLIQDVHTLLKSGIVETMRPGSKSAAWAWRIEGGIQVGIGKRNESYLYADIDSFIPQSGKERGVIESLILPYLDSELKRINIYKTNPKAKNYIGYNAKANQQGEAFGEIFNVFNGILINKTQNELKELITDPNVSLLDYLEENTELKNKIIREIYSYFTNKTTELYNQYNEASYYDPKLINKLSQIDVSETEKQKILLKAFFYNNWIHNVETSILFFSGDIAQLDHSKENGHKRTSGLISNGPRLRTDISAQKYISNVDEGGFNNSTYARTLGEKYDKFRYDGYVNTAIIQDIARDSIYAPEMRVRFEKDIKAKYPKLSDSEVKRLVEKKVSKYLEGEIKEGDGQGYITIDAYRAFKKLQNKWSNDQERLYQKVIKGEEISLDDLTEGFPVYKLQNFGFAEDTVLPVGIMHKFALFPLVPSAIKGTELEALHKKMLEDNIQYATFASGSKTGGVTSDGKPDQIFEEGSKKIKADAKFTNNRIHAGFIKEVTNVPSKLKGEVIFSTQLRKLIIEGLYEHGSYTSEKAKQLADNYKNIVDFYTAVLTKELETEIGYRKDEKGVYIGKPDKFLKLIQRNLEQKDYPNHIIDALKLNPDGTLKSDLSYFIDTEGIENIVMSIINKKLVKQKVNGEALVQVASSMWNGSWDAYQGNKFKNLKGKELEEATRKYLGTNNLPFYTEGADGKTSAMKVAVALQGDFFNLLNLLDNDGEKIGTRERLNEMIKDEDWLNKDNNRKSITMTAVRIPVQGLNSMEFMEVYEFLDPTAQNVIILPTEIVGKSGGDYDVDKLTTFFPNINEDGSYAMSSVSNNKFTEEITNIESAKKNPKEFIKNQKRAVQNQMIQAIRSILEIPENYTSLLTPNDTDILKPLADDLQKYVSPRDKYAKANGEPSNISAKGRKMISPTSMFEPLYNNEKFGANMGGKGVLGIFANDNALHPLLTSIGAKMPMKFKDAKFMENLKRWIEKKDSKPIFDMRIFLPHHVVDGHISLSNINTVNGTKIADLYSQGVNGSVDVEADEWIFYIQGNLEVASTLSYLVKAGVPEDAAVYFVSNPLVREYAKRQRLAKGVFGEATKTGSVDSKITQYDSANYVFRKYIPQFIKNKLEGISPDEKLTVIINEPSMVNKFGEDKKYEYTVSELLNNLNSITSNPDLKIKSVKTANKSIYEFFNPSTRKIHQTSTNLSNLPGVLKNDQLDTKRLYDLITTQEEFSPEQLDFALAAFAHFLEIEKQTKGLGALKNLIKPDVKTLRTIQEAVIKNLNIELLENNSKVDTETANRAINESIISRFGNTEIIEKIFMPLMPLVNSNKVSRFIADSIGGYGESSKNKIDAITKIYGAGQDGISNFINSFKTGLKTFIFQNYLSNFIDANGSLTTLPNKYYGQNVKINNNLDTDAAVINGEFIVNEKRVTQDFEQKRYLSDNTQPGNYSSREGLVPFDLANDVFNTKELYFKYVLERERLFFLGLRGDELNQMALVNAFNPNVLLGNNKYSYTDLLLSTIDKNRKALSKNYDIIDQIRKAVELKNVNVLTLSNKRTLTGSEQSRYATELKALGNPRIQKVEDPEENTRISRLFRLLPQINIYQHGVGKTFYGFDFALPMDDYEQTMTAAGDLFKNNYDNTKTFDLVFKKLTESKARVKNLVVSPEQYNTYVPLKAEYAEPLDLDEDQVFEAQKPVFTAPTPTTQPTEVKVISEDYGVVQAETNPTKSNTQQIIDLISPQIEKQAYKENVGGNANWQFSFGNMWSRVNLKAKPLVVDSFAGVSKTKAQIEKLKKEGKDVDKSKFIYDYHELDQNGNPLPSITDLQPLIDKIQSALGIDMSNYDSMLGNIYLDNQSIAPHRDTTEAKSAANYPVIVYTIGNDSGLGIWDDNKGKMTFQGAYKEDFQGRRPTNEITTTDGTVYTFGMDGKGRFALSHTTPLGNIKKNPFPPIKLSDGRVITNYTITLTFRRAADLTPGMPTTPAKITTTQPATSVKPRIDLSREWKGDLESRPVYTPEGVNTMRSSATNAFTNFGNPFSEAGYGGTIKVPSIGAAVIAYKEWLLGTNHKDVKPQQREWILDQINQGKLDGATLLYAGKLEARGQGMHPTALAEVVEQLRSNKPSTQPTAAPTTAPVSDVRILNNLQKLKEFGIYNVFLSRKTYEEVIDNIDKGYPSFIYGKVGIGPEKIDTYELLTPQEISDVYNRIVNKIKNGGLTEVVAKNYILDLNIIRSQIGKLGESNDLSNSVEDFISGKTDTTLTLEDQRDIDPIEQMVIDKYITLKLLKENDLASRYINVFASFALKKIAVSILKLKGRNVTKDIESQFYNNINDEEKSIIEKVDNIINKKGQATLEEAKPSQQQAPINYNNVPKVQVQPTLEPGRYVNFDNNIWIVTKQNTNGTWQIYNPNLEGVNSKKSVAEKNLGIRPEIAKIVNYRDQEYLVTPNETIISLVTNKKMNWNNNDGNRIGILQLANNTVSSTQPTVPVSETTDDYTFTFADGTPIPVPFKLNEQQQAALLGLEKFYNNPSEYNNEIALIGYAGTGKTTIMSLFDKYIMSKGEMPKYSAPTHRANAVTKLNNPAADVITLHKAFGLNPVVDLTNGQLSVENLQSEQTGKPLVAYGDYLIIDESSMITDQLYKFIEEFKKNFKIKVIYMGDPAQLAPVDPRKKETALSVALEKPTKLELTKVERTSDNPILTESTNLREGKPLSGISDEVNGRGVEYMSDSARTNQVIGQSLQEMQETGDFLHFRMLSAKNNGIKTLNDLARKNLYNVDDSTELVDGEILMGYDNFGGDKDSYDIYNSGDYRVIGISEETKKVIDTDTALGKLEFIGYDIVLEDLLQKDSKPVFVFIAKKGSINEGSSKKLIAALSELARKGKNATDKRTRGMYFSMMYALRKEVAFMEDQYNDYGKIAIKKTVDYGYAHTIHKSQGGTYNKVLILLDTIDKSKFDDTVKQQLRYVAVSRARDYVYLIKNSGPLSQTTEDVTEVERTPGDNVISSITLEQLTKGKPTVASKAAAELPMDDVSITKIINGTKVIIDKTALFSDGVYTIGSIQQVQLKYLGKGVVVGNNIVITDENTKQSYVRSKDDFAKGEGFKNWSDFQLNNKFAQKFISGEAGRYIYFIKPIGEIKDEIGAAQKLNPENNPAIAAFNQKLVENKGTLPKEFIYDSGSFTSKYVLNPNNLYNLVDVETGTIYLRNINLQTGNIVSIDEPLIPVSDKRVAEIISGLRSQIKAYRLDEILAEKGIDINEEIDKLENVNFESELNEIMVRINKNMC
jgi:exodeoxyribonuclease-5